MSSRVSILFICSGFCFETVHQGLGVFCPDPIKLFLKPVLETSFSFLVVAYLFARFSLADLETVLGQRLGSLIQPARIRVRYSL